MMKLIVTAVTICLFFSGFASAATIQLPSTGQTVCYQFGAHNTTIDCTGSGQDGDKRKGATWPSPRFIDNVNGTVTDNLTGLIWLKNANCFGLKTWTDALTSATTLATGSCALSDGSASGQWRLPDRKELMSLVDYSRQYDAGYPLTSVAPFTSVQASGYWSSGTYAPDTGSAWAVVMNSAFDVNRDIYAGAVYSVGKSSGIYVWPVRGGQ